MKNKKGRLIDSSKVGFGLLTESLLDAGANMGAEVVKESLSSLVKEFFVDTVSSSVPGFGGAVLSYKRMRTEKNLIALIYHLHDSHEMLIMNLKQQTEKNREILDNLLLYILEMTMDEYQEEKIEYMANGYINLTNHREITSDFVMHYYDLLKQLRMVDISVLRLYYNIFNIMYDSEGKGETFRDVMEKHGMSYDQYNSVREVLRRNGLLELEVKDEIDNDMSKLEEGINKLVGYIEHINSKKRSRPPKISKVKMKQKSKETLKLSKFGKDFYVFFGEIKESKDN